jgi:type I restriction enzyme M protein
LDIKNPNNGSEEKEYSLNELLTIMRDKSDNIHRLLGELSEALKGVEE